MPEGLMPKRRAELQLCLQPIVESPSLRFSFLLPDEIGAHRDVVSVAAKQASDICFSLTRNPAQKNANYSIISVCRCRFMGSDRYASASRSLPPTQNVEESLFIPEKYWGASPAFRHTPILKHIICIAGASIWDTIEHCGSKKMLTGAWRRLTPL